MGRKNRLSQEEIESLYYQYKDLIFRMAMIRLGNEQDAYDIVQTVFLKLMTQKDFKDLEHEKRWLIRVASNACYSILRKPWRKHKEFTEELQQKYFENDIENYCILDSVLHLPDNYNEEKNKNNIGKLQ